MVTRLANIDNAAGLITSILQLFLSFGKVGETCEDHTTSA